VLADRLDLPVEAMHLASPLGVGGVSFERAVLGMDVDLDPPSRRRHCEIDADRPSVRRSQHGGLSFDRHAERAQLGGERDLGM
jgi:hypothetical protein